MAERIRLVRERPGPAQVKAVIDDAELAHMLVEGDPRAVRASWLRFAPFVHHLLKRALGPDDDVRELAQLVFERFFRRIAQLRDRGELRPVVIALTTNALRAELRNRRTRRWLHVGQAGAAPRNSSVPPDSPSREALRRLYSILDRFKTEDRIAFAFHFLQGLSLEEVAAALNLSLPTTQRVLARVWSRIVLLIEKDIALLDYLSCLEEEGACA
jgi:RNA polymerase sigma-70 factor (ECF subfamily)